MFEAEIKIKIDDPARIANHLMELGFCKKHRVRETDRYFDNAKELIRTTGRSLRVRLTTDLETEISSATLNLKGAKADKLTMSREENEINVSSGEDCCRLLSDLGFSAVPPIVEKIRTTLTLSDMTACLDEVKGLGSFLELEILTEDSSKREEAVRRMEVLLKDLGYSLENSLQTSYMSLLAGTRE